ncbi:MAG: FadR family transcriptional regulator [Deltaproteobacteria bacterium]|nr:FadR family transcriptional regulator [Deltaproteobacteria bacterium]
MKAIRAPRTADLVASWLRDQIFEGKIKAGELLPSERKLAEIFKINRHTLRSALAHLEAEGLVRARQGEGVRVLDYRKSGGLEMIANLPKEHQNDILAQILELRRAVAIEAIALACLRATTEQIDEMLVLAALQEDETDTIDYMKRDLEFARLVLRAADNLPMELLFNSVDRFYRARPDIARHRFDNLEETRGTYNLVVELISRRDPAVARDVVKAALEYVDAKTLEKRGLRKKRRRNSARERTQTESSPLAIS